MESMFNDKNDIYSDSYIHFNGFRYAITLTLLFKHMYAVTLSMLFFASTISSHVHAIWSIWVKRIQDGNGEREEEER